MAAVADRPARAKTNWRGSGGSKGTTANSTMPPSRYQRHQVSGVVALRITIHVYATLVAKPVAGGMSTCRGHTAGRSVPRQDGRTGKSGGR